MKHAGPPAPAATPLYRPLHSRRNLLWARLGTMATMTYPERFVPLAALLALAGMTAMVMAVLQFQGPLMSRPAPPMQLCQSVDSHGNGTLYTASHC